MAANSSNLIFRQFDHAVDAILDYILARNPQTILEFFLPFDAHSGRIFQSWEFSLIFPGMQDSAWEQIHLKNSESARLMKGEVECDFLYRELQRSQKMPQAMYRAPMPSTSVYIEKRVNGAVEHSLQLMAQHPDIRHNLAQAYDMIFALQTQVDHKAMGLGFQRNSIGVYKDQDLLELCQYFQVNPEARGFTKIEFVQGMGPWLSNKRPAGGQKAELNAQGQPIQYNAWKQQIQFDTFGRPLHFDTNGQQIPYDQFGNLIYMPVVFDSTGKPLQVDQKGNLITPMTQPQFANNTFSFGGDQIKHQPTTIIQPKVDYNTTCTAAAQNSQILRPLGFTSHQHAYQIDEIIKGCCVRDMLVFDYFERYANQSTIKLTEFEAAINALGCSWPSVRNTEIFNAFDLVMNGKQVGQLSTKDVDAYVHFSAKKTLEQLHYECLQLIDENRNKLQKPEDVFFKICRGNTYCSRQDFKDSLSILQVKLTDLDVNFVIKKYYVSETQYDYNKFIEDLSKALFQTQNQQANSGSTMSVDSVVEAVTKRLYTLGKQMTPYLTSLFNDRPLSQTDFVNAIGKELNLVPEVCTDRTLLDIYSHLSQKNTKYVSIFEITQYFERAVTRTENEMKEALLQELTGRMQFAVVQKFFEDNPNYQRTKKMILTHFIKLLTDQLGFKKLDAEFIATFFKQGEAVDAANFLGALSGKTSSQIKITLPKQTLTTNQKQALQYMQTFLVSKKIEAEFIKTLRSNSIGSSEYMSFNSLRAATQQTFSKHGVKPMSDLQTRELISCLLKDKNGEYNWHQLVGMLFGEDKAQLLLYQEIAKAPAGQVAGQQNQGGSKSKILTDQELRKCQDILCQANKDIMATGKKPADVFEPLRTQPTQKSVAPKIFADVLKKSVTPSTKALLNNDVLKLIIYYLIREVPREVSFTKLYSALNLPESEPPLKQDGISQELQYEAQVKRQLTDSSNRRLPLSVLELQTFMNRSDITLDTLLGVDTTKTTEMTIFDFQNALKKSGYESKYVGELIKDLQTAELSQNKVSITILQKHLKSAPSTQTQKAKIGKMSDETRQKLAQISDYLQKNKITLDQFHQMLDQNKDGKVDMAEFIDGVKSIVLSERITRDNLTAIFKAIDINNDGHLSVNEFSLFLEGAKLKREQRINRLDPSIKAQVEQECKQLYQKLTENSEKIDANGICRTTQAIGKPVSIEQAQEMIKRVDTDNDGKISEQEYMTIMQPIVMDSYINSEQEVEDLRALFKDADTDYSGFLSIDEFYITLLKMGADVTRDDVVAYFSEFDVNSDMQLDIDEFIAIMVNGNQINFSEEKNMQTHLKIKKSRQVDALDFLKAFSHLPISYTPSFFSERWHKTRRNLPSSVFQVQIDQRTLLWKDLLPVETEQLTSEQMRADTKPYLKSLPSSLGAQLHIDGAEGIPLPKDAASRENIVKRCVRVGLFDKVKQDFIYNSSAVVATWSAKQEDIWTFKDVNSLNPLLFRSTQEDDLNKEDIVFVFELVVFYKQGLKTKDMCCGWAEAPLNLCEKANTKVKLPINGGSPQSRVNIAKEDIHSKRSGVKGLMKVFNNNITSSLTVTFKPITTIEADVRTHLDMMPSTCLLHKSMVFLLSGYRNYIAKKLLAQSQVGILKKPTGDVVISCVPKILDCPDVLETVIHVWETDYLKTLTQQHRKSIDYLMRTMEDIVTRLYPVFYSVEFGHQNTNFYDSVCADQAKLNLRQQLVRSALKHNNPQVKSKVERIENLTTFKPFNVKELNYEVWDDSEAKFDQILSHYENIGIFSQKSPVAQKQQNDAPKIIVPEVK